MYTDKNSTAAVCTREENEPIVLGFPCATELKQGTIVKLATDGTVAAVTAVTDRPLGRVTSGWDGNDAGQVRVLTPFSAEVRGLADGTVAIGAELAALSFDGTANLQNYKAAVATNWVSAIALSGGADNAEIVVGVLRVPYYKPVVA